VFDGYYLISIDTWESWWLADRAS